MLQSAQRPLASALPTTAPQMPLMQHREYSLVNGHGSNIKAGMVDCPVGGVRRALDVLRPITTSECHVAEANKHFTIATCS